MYAGLASNIAKKFQDCGFEATPLGFGVVVSLNRNISTLEVESILDKFFQGNYKVTKIASNMVMIDDPHNC